MSPQKVPLYPLPVNPKSHEYSHTPFFLDIIFVPLSKYLGVELLSDGIVVYLTFLRNYHTGGTLYIPTNTV